jgi:sarcosine oxidase
MATTDRSQRGTIVIGGGVMGCAAAYHLARRGQPVRLLEQYDFGTDRGSSHGESRIIRLAYDSADYVQLAVASYALWRELESDVDSPLLHTTGGIDFGSPGSHMLAGIGATYDALGVPYDALDRADLVRRFPQFDPPQDAIGYYQSDYAVLFADRCVAGLAAQAQRAGAEFHSRERVYALSATDSGVTVRTDVGQYEAESVVVAAGSWMRALLLDTGIEIPLTVTTEISGYFQPDHPDAFQPGRFPLFIQHLRDTTSNGCGFPDLGHGVKLILDRTGAITDPDLHSDEVSTTQLDRLNSYVAGVVPALAGTLIEIVPCRYTMTPDEHFIIDQHPDSPRIIIASPCSGHGFKFAPAIGQILADLATTGETTFDISRFRLGRPALAPGHRWTSPVHGMIRAG